MLQRIGSGDLVPVDCLSFSNDSQSPKQLLDDGMDEVEIVCGGDSCPVLDR